MMSAAEQSARDRAADWRAARFRCRQDVADVGTSGGFAPLPQLPTQTVPGFGSGGVGFAPLRPWLTGYGAVSPLSAVCWMSPGVLAAAGAHMGVAVPPAGSGSALLRDVLARSATAAPSERRRFPVAEPSPEVQADSSQQPGDEDGEQEELESGSASPADSDAENATFGAPPCQTAGPGSPTVVNGCKKRKLYQPVQHEAGGGSEAEASPQLAAAVQQYHARLYRDNGLAESEKERDEPPRPVPPLHKLDAPPPPPAATFIDYARRVLAADPRNKENERAHAADVEALADALKAEITSSLAGLIDQIVSKWAQQRRREPDPYAAAQERRSPRAEILRRISQQNGRFPGLSGGHAFPGLPGGHAFPGGGDQLPFGLPALAGLRPPLLAGSRPVGYYSGLCHGPQGLQPPDDPDDAPLSLVTSHKKKRHKVTDTRALARPAGARPEDPPGSPPPPHLLPASLPTSVAIPNPSLQQSRLLAGYRYCGLGSPERRACDSPQPMQGLLHPCLLGGGSPDSAAGYGLDGADRTPDRSDASLESAFDQRMSAFPNRIDARSGLSLASEHSSTLTPMHLRKAKLMFFWSRYPSSSILKSYFPDINFNKNNTAQLVKWFSNFREFFYIQMEKYSRQALSEGVKSAEELNVPTDCELLRVLNLHYNRNNHIEIPANFPYVTEAALREFFRALQAGRDTEPSWKKAIYKVIARLDETVPEYFRMPSFLEQLE